ncbi:4Fe-4S binding protein [Hollandina sp. SP2]
MAGTLIIIFVLLSGIIWGRLFCGKICPIGYIQSLIFKIPFPKKIRTFMGDKYFRYIKYVVLLVSVISNIFFPSSHEINNAALNGFSIIIPIFIVFIIFELPLCKYFCHFGALISLGNKISPYKYRVNNKCIKCGLCSRVCKMNIEPFKTPNNLECTRCGLCKKVCPYKAIITGFGYGKNRENKAIPPCFNNSKEEP